MHDSYKDRASIADLERRLTLIEKLWMGVDGTTPHPMSLVTLYWDACRTTVFDDPITARHWERQIFVLDARNLLTMARATHDPTCWHPILVLTDRLIANGFDHLEAARQHLLSISQDLLNLQGLKKLRPRDIAGNPLRVKSALAAISRRHNL